MKQGEKERVPVQTSVRTAQGLRAPAKGVTEVVERAASSEFLGGCSPESGGARPQTLLHLREAQPALGRTLVYARHQQVHAVDDRVDAHINTFIHDINVFMRHINTLMAHVGAPMSRLSS